MCDNTLFLCLMLSWGCDELEAIVGVGSCNTTSFGVLRLVWTRTTSIVCSTVLWEWVEVFFCEKKDGFSTFWWFRIKLAGFERISRVMLVLVGVFESEEVKYGSKFRWQFNENSAVESFLWFCPFSDSTGYCDMSRRVGEPIFRCLEVQSQYGCLW